MCPWQWMDGQGPSGQCSPGQEWWIQLHQWIAVINRVARRWRLTATRQHRAPGVASKRPGRRRNAGQSGEPALHTAMFNKRKVCIAKKMKCIDTEAGRLTDLSQQRVVSERIALRTSTQRLDKSRLYIVFLCSPKWNVLHPCLLGCIDMERH